MTDLEAITEIVGEFVDGWRERIEYMKWVQNHDTECGRKRSEMAQGELRHYTCRCPRRLEARAESRRQHSLLDQLRRMDRCERHGATDGRAPASKPGSRPPGNLDPLDLLWEVHGLTFSAHTWAGVSPRSGPLEGAMRALVSLSMDAQAREDVHTGLRRLRRQARLVIGYDVPWQMLDGTVCGVCGGGLIVASDASSHVRCIGTADADSCGKIYYRWQWVALLDGAA